MAQAIDSSSAPFKAPPTSSGNHAFIEAAGQSETAADDEGHSADPCLQDVDPSHASRASHQADCNLDCCTCAVRWSARRSLLENEA